MHSNCIITVTTYPLPSYHDALQLYTCLNDKTRQHLISCNDVSTHRQCIMHTSTNQMKHKHPVGICNYSYALELFSTVDF